MCPSDQAPQVPIPQKLAHATPGDTCATAAHQHSHQIAMTGTTGTKAPRATSTMSARDQKPRNCTQACCAGDLPVTLYSSWQRRRAAPARCILSTLKSPSIWSWTSTPMREGGMGSELQIDCRASQGPCRHRLAQHAWDFNPIGPVSTGWLQAAADELAAKAGVAQKLDLLTSTRSRLL